MASRAACRAKRRTNPSREEAAPRAFSSGAASDLSGSLEESVAMDALEWPRRAASIAFRPSRGPLAASPLPGSYDHFGLRCRSRGPNRCQARLIVTSLLPNFSAASWTISSIRMFFLPLSVLCHPLPTPLTIGGATPPWGKLPRDGWATSDIINQAVFCYFSFYFFAIFLDLHASILRDSAVVRD